MLFGIVTTLVQFMTYYFFESYVVIWGISCLASVICCHLLLEQSTSYEACFHYSLMTVFVSLVITVVSYFGKVQTFLPFTYAMIGIIVINWLVPLFHCYLRNMLDYGTRIEGFPNFYRNISFLFLTFYAVLLLVGSFIRGIFPWAFPYESDAFNLLPFNMIATMIEDYLYDYVSLGEILTYLTARIVAFIPYGFYITLLLRRQSKLLRFLALLQLPFLIELLQYFFIPAYCDIDDLIYGLIGGLFGSIFFYLSNTLFRVISGKDFLSRDNDYRYSGSSMYY
jgi:glycopeptide antibiotics resistance protein